ncbi:hypothetical protein GPECTOR_962g228 [Gonium pectorale]|uniref:DUF659 domain-containing protein n=1 Tax=Gonium pectorale TaxID=33097 RepID=A0A150FTT0_GONPE|nr:hypothetical protein GPECTOR_962g228 [Gonium pectorale]|eukprot:KXZ41022.1 hypothetical protein GPECTOR_962g228 [Gonium pectorale]
MLEEAYDDTTTGLDFFYSKVDETGCTVAGDGWSDAQHRPIQNTMLCANNLAVFHDSFDMTGLTKDAQTVAGKMMKAITEIGPEKVVCVITDSASNCKAAGEIIHEAHPHIFWVPCAAHCLDLMLEDIGKLDSAKYVINKVKEVIIFVKNKHTPLAIFNKHSKLKVLLPGETRFATEFLVLDRSIKVRRALKKMLADRKFEKWTKAGGKSRKDEVAEIAKLINADGFWVRVQELVDLTGPIVVVLRLADSSAPTTGKIYHECLKLQQHVEEKAEAMTSFKLGEKKQLKESVKSRCEMLHNPLHAAGYLLDPEFWDVPLKDVGRKVMDGFREVVRAMLDNTDLSAKAEEELVLFKRKEGPWGGMQLASAQANASKLPGSAWHQMYSMDTLLQKIAVRVLAQPTSACACERNWSAYEFIHSTRRNKLDPERAKKLVYVFTNRRILNRVRKPGFREEVVPWQREWEEDSEDEEETVMGGSSSEGETSEDA